jgi:hypothetical protein
MHARAVDEAAAELRRKWRRTLEAALLAVLAGACSPVVWITSPALGIGLAAGAGSQALIALGLLVSRHGRIEELALDPTAYTIPEVRAYGAKLVGRRQRELLARSLLSLVRDAFNPGALYLGDRVTRYARELEAIARDLLSPRVRVQPVCAATCRWLLTHAAESPLYNQSLPVEDLGSILHRIRAGMQSDA